MATPMTTDNNRFDVFVGNVRDNTTEDQLHQVFSIVGPVKKVRILMDQDSGRPKGFAFVEFHEASSALAAIRHLDGHEVNSRRLRVSYSNNSNLKEVAQTIGPDAIPDFSHLRPEFNAVKDLQLHEAWDILDAMKHLVDEDRARARTLLESHPQLVEALVQIQRRLGMIPTLGGGLGGAGGSGGNGGSFMMQADSMSAPTSSTGNVVNVSQGQGHGGSGGLAGMPGGGDPIQQAILMARAQAEARGMSVGAVGARPAYQPPPQQAPAHTFGAPPPPGQLPQLPPEIEEIMRMSDEQIMGMAPEHRHHVLAIREEVYASLGMQMPPPPSSQQRGGRWGYQ